MKDNEEVVDELSRISKQKFDILQEEMLKNIKENSKEILRLKYNLLFEYNIVEDYSDVYENQLLPLEKKLTTNDNLFKKLNKKYDDLYDSIDGEIIKNNKNNKNSRQLLRETKNAEGNITDLMKEYIENQKKLYDANKKKYILENSILEI